MNGDVFDVLNYCILIGNYYIHRHNLFNDNKINFHEHLLEYIYNLQVTEMAATKQILAIFNLDMKICYTIVI